MTRKTMYYISKILAAAVAVIVVVACGDTGSIPTEGPKVTERVEK
jgi:hypothetical protein